MKKLIFILVLLASAHSGFSQSEPADMITYDSTITLPMTDNVWGSDHWNVRITRPNNSDTASRPAIITMPGQGELGTKDTSKLTVYGPHYWLKNGWEGSVQLGNGKHYPILITVCYTDNPYPTGVAYSALLTFLEKTYRIKKGSVYLGGLSQGSFSAGALIEYEHTPGDETGMKLVKAAALFEGTPDPLPMPYKNWCRYDGAFAVWAAKYSGRLFTLEGNGPDNFRDSWHQANAMNAAVPGSAYFCYESDGGGSHCCWNDFYNPSATNWSYPGGAYTAPSQAGTNQMGDYHAPSSVFQWMLRQGDTSLVGIQPAILPPIANAGAPQTITLPIDSVILHCSGSIDTARRFASCSWTEISGPNTVPCNGNGVYVSGLIAGTYIFQLTITDNRGATGTATTSVTVLPAVKTVTKIVIYYSDGSTLTIP